MSIVVFAPHAAAVDDLAVPPVPLFLCVEPCLAPPHIL